VLVAVFVLSTAVAYGYFSASGSAKEYRTEGVIPPPASITNPAEALQYVADLRAALGSDVVAERVARKVDATKVAIEKRLTSQREGDSAIIAIAYTTKSSSEDAAAVLRTAVSETGTFLAEGRAASNQAQLDAANDDVADAVADQGRADAAVAEFLQRNGGADPDAVLQAVESQLVDLRVTEARAAAEGDGAGASLAQQARTALTEELPELRSRAAEFAPLRRAATVAADAVDQAESVRSATLRQAQNEIPGFHVSISARNKPVSQTSAWLRQSIAVGAAATVVAALFIAWLPARSRSRGRRQQSVSPGVSTA
jgi:hypothetical protein